MVKIIESYPYKTVNNLAKGAAERQKEIPTPAIARTWITAYDTPYWKPTVVYDASKIGDQAQALVDAGLTGGFITWNGKSSLNKYTQIKEAFSKNYSLQDLLYHLIQTDWYNNFWYCFSSLLYPLE